MSGLTTFKRKAKARLVSIIKRVRSPTPQQLTGHRFLRAALAAEKGKSLSNSDHIRRRAGLCCHRLLRSESFACLVGVLPTVVSPGAIWTEIESGFHIELETAIRINVFPDQRRDGAQIRRR